MTPQRARKVRERARCVHDAAAVSMALDRQACAITEQMSQSDPLLLAVMTGGMWPTVELSRRLIFPHGVDYLHATRYRGARRGGEIQWRVWPDQAIEGRNVLIVDDILDEGHTLAAVKDACSAAGAHSVRTAVLVVKRNPRRSPDVGVDFHALEVDDVYVFGCGMDIAEYWRGLPEIYAVTDDDAC